MSCFFEEIYLEEQEFLEQFDEIMDSITDETQKVWVIGHKVALVPVKLYELLAESVSIGIGEDGRQV